MRKKRPVRNAILSGSGLRYFILNKPYGVMCQFSDSSGRKTLADFGKFTRDVYPVGRLDFDSEGLVLLTNDGKLKDYLLNPENMHPRTYLVQVENIPDDAALKKLRAGINLRDYKTRAAEVELLESQLDIPPRQVPIRFRKNIPTAWLKLTIYEGKNRQVRRMTAAVGHPTLRLIRISIGPLTIGNLKPCEVRELLKSEIRNLKNQSTTLQ
jgi:23S rRNA pseudouridine2457 synthase